MKGMRWTLIVVLIGSVLGAAGWFMAVHSTPTDDNLSSEQKQRITSTSAEGNMRNEIRKQHLDSISRAIEAYRIDHQNDTPTYPPVIYGGEECEDEEYRADDIAVCAQGKECNGVSLDSFLIPKYLDAIPVDPSVTKGEPYSGYTVFRLPDDRIKVCATLSEGAPEHFLNVVR